MPELPEFPLTDRQLALLARQAGFETDELLELPMFDRDVLEAWLQTGRKELEAKTETDAARFVQQWDRAEGNQLQAEVVALNRVRQAARENPADAQKWLLELETQRKLKRSRELTTW